MTASQLSDTVGRYPGYHGVGEFTWWVSNLAGLVQIVRAAGFARVEPAEPFELPFAGGGRWKGLRGAVHARA